MTVRRLNVCRIFLLAGLAAVSLPASAFLDQLNEWIRGSPFPVVHSKYVAVSHGAFYRLSWLDNDRIFFAGEPIEEVLARFDGKRFVRAGKKRFYIWNTRTNEVTTYREDVDDFGTFCYNEHENWITYPVPGNKNAVMEGRFGEEKAVEINPAEHTIDGQNKRGVFFSNLTCREHPYAPKDSGVGSPRVLPLHDDHGILDAWGSSGDARPIKYFSGEYHFVRDLSLPRRAIAPSKSYYSRYKGAYVLTGFTAPPSFSNTWGSWPANVDQPVYLLSTTGKLSLGGEIPWHKGSREALAVYFSVRGIVYAGRGRARQKGFYLVVGGETIPLLTVDPRLSIDGGGESPDGCKVAVALSMYGANKAGGLKYVDLCREKGQ
jgi:hypothetical protein